MRGGIYISVPLQTRLDYNNVYKSYMKMYKNKELVITCKYCGKEKKIRTKRDIRENGNYCSYKCFKNYEMLNSQTDENKRLKWNTYQRLWKLRLKN